MSSKRATEWETPPPTPQTPAASAGAAAVAAPGNNAALASLTHPPTHTHARAGDGGDVVQGTGRGRKAEGQLRAH